MITLCVEKNVQQLGINIFTVLSKSLYSRYLSNQLWLEKVNKGGKKEAGRESFLDRNYLNAVILFP